MKHLKLTSKGMPRAAVDTSRGCSLCVSLGKLLGKSESESEAKCCDKGSCVC